MDKLDAGKIVVSTIAQMAQSGKPLMTRVLPESDVHFWEHYPEDDARDAVTRSRWYYHVHAPGDRDPAEHGHFHLFLHRSQMPRKAALLCGPPADDQPPAKVAHVAGLSIDHSGIPIGWFATNRWVTDEYMYPAETLNARLDRFSVDNAGEDELVDRLITAMVGLYRDELGKMLRARDTRLAELMSAEGRNASESGNDILASCPIDLDERIGSLGLF